MWDNDNIKSDDLVGESEILLSDIGKQPNDGGNTIRFNKRVDLKYKGKQAGVVNVDFEFIYDA